MKNVLLFLGVLKLSAMMLAAESLQRDMDDNGVVWIYEKGAESIIRGIDRASTTCDVRRLSFPVELGGKPVFGIAAESFRRFENLEEVVIPPGIRQIDRCAFAGCSNLVHVKMMSGVRVVRAIREGAFANCKKLSNLEFPIGLETISNDAFFGCDGLKEITLPKSCFLANEGFNYCRGLRRIDVCNAFEFYPYSGSFVGCEALSEILVSKENEKFEVVDGILYSKDGKFIVRCPPRLTNEEVKIRDGVLGICPYAFDCCMLKAVSLPGSLIGVGYGAFHRCTNLALMTIPADVKLIERMAFDGCCRLESVKFLGDTSQITIEDNAFPPEIKFSFARPACKSKESVSDKARLLPR